MSYKLDTYFIGKPNEWGPKSRDKAGQQMEWSDVLTSVTSAIVLGIAIMSLLQAGIALTLIEFWGIKTIWKLMNKPGERKT